METEEQKVRLHKVSLQTQRNEFMLQQEAYGKEGAALIEAAKHAQALYLFAGDSDEEPAKPVKKKDGLFDEDDFDDFIEDDLGIQQALKREHEASLKGARDGPATDVSQMQLMDMVRIRVL